MKNETQYTPGPWRVITSNKDAIVIVSDDYGFICDLPSGENYEQRIKHLDNAVLIASAPETAAERDRLKKENEKLKSELHDNKEAAKNETKKQIAQLNIFIEAQAVQISQLQLRVNHLLNQINFYENTI